MYDVLDLFSGAAGGWSLGMHRAGFRTVAACEAVPWRRALYAQNNPAVRTYDDIRTLSADRIVSDIGYFPPVVVGSPPCQDISSANTKGRGVEGERSGLYFEAVRLIGEGRPRWLALENSSNLRTRGADAVLAALEGLGYACWPFVVGAGNVGASHKRKRSWLIGCDPEQLADADRDPIRLTELPGRAGQVAPVAGEPSSYANRKIEHALLVDAEMAIMRGLAADHDPRNTPNPDQAGQADGCVVAGLRQPEIALDGCGDGPGTGQMGLCAADRGDPEGCGPLWSLADLAHRIRMDDGLPARLAGTRVGVGGPRGTSAAPLIAEAYGDAVVPQITEAIARAIIRVERALKEVS